MQSPIHPPASIDDDGLLLGWSLEHEQQRQPIGFSFGQKADTHVTTQKQHLDPILLESGGHVATIAPTGSGKGVSCVIPNLLHYQGQAVVIDPKGENYAVTAEHRRKMGHQIVVIDPFNITDAPVKDSLNPLDLIASEHDSKDTLFDECAALASLVIERGADKDPFWENSAHELVSSLIAIVATQFENSRDLLFVSKMLNEGEFKLSKFVKQLNEQTDDMFLGVSGLFDGNARQTISGIVTVAKQNLLPFKNGAVGKALSSSSFSLLDYIAGKPMTIYLVLPPDKLFSHRKVLRMWIGTLIRLTLKRTCAPAKPTLLMLDEAAQLGHLEELVQAVTLLRGYGMQVWSFWQDIHQLKANYPKNWQTLLNNCRAIQSFGFPNRLACEAICEVTGFASPGALLDLDRDEMLLQLAGDDAVVAQKPCYLSDRTFKGKADLNPFHSETDAKGFVPVHPQRIYVRKSSPPKEEQSLDDLFEEFIDETLLED